MKILYSVQATGNGHISRAHQLYPYLTKLGQVDILLSGSNSTLKMDIPVKYRIPGISIYYSKCGGLDYLKTINKLSYFRAIRDASCIPVEKYDLVINDFDHVTAKACASRQVPSVQFGHQASFMSPKTPRPSVRNILGEWILTKFVPATHYIGLHFDRFDDFIFPPVIKDKFLQAKPADHGHITVYLPSYKLECHDHMLQELSNTEFHVFTNEVDKRIKKGNITCYPVSQEQFNESLIYCHGLVTGGGFETPAEALFLGKKLLSIPISGQYEQQCNAAALKSMGIPTLKVLDNSTKNKLFSWIESDMNPTRIIPNDIPATLDYLLNTVNTIYKSKISA